MQLKYEIEKKKYSELKENIVIPKFQRGLVWSSTKKREFIKTLKEGNPIGVLLLYRETETSKYQVIDGLQRFTTMMDYSANYFKYIDKEEITDRNIGLLISLSDRVGHLWDNLLPEKQLEVKEQIRDIIVDGLSKRKAEDNLLQLSKNIASQLKGNIDIFAGESATDSLLDTIYNFINDLETNQTIDDIEIPLIIYKGNKEDLANIFQKLNQEGVKLSKYDVFAATWINSYVHVTDQEIKKAIIEKYSRAQEDANLDISDFDPDEVEETGQLTVYEYAYALGKKIQNKCPLLFTSTDDSKVDSIGFLILTELVGLSYQNMGDLAKKLTETYCAVNIDKLTEAVIWSCQQVADSLSDYLASPASGGRKKASLACHSELQLVSYIIVLFKYKYLLSPSEGIKETGKNKEEIKKVLSNIPCHYLYDIIRGFWAGSGDSKLEAIINSSLDSCRYLLKASKDSFEHEVRTWLTLENEKPISKQVTRQAKLFWTYILRNNGVSSKTKKYDIEHCVTQDSLKKFLINNHVDVPVSTPCNLCYLPPRDNRQKKAETYYQYHARTETAYEISEAQLEKYVYPRKSELEFMNSSETFTKDNYMAFLSKRVDVIVEQIMKCFYE